MTEEYPDRVIRGRACHYHSAFRAVPIYRAYDVKTGHLRAQYFALCPDEVLEAFTLENIKRTIGQWRNGVPLTDGEVWDRIEYSDGALLKFCPEVKG